jgi:cyclophilin family peptidyl-prolyl cis-trans isomerase/HEAT repeat protein
VIDALGLLGPLAAAAAPAIADASTGCRERIATLESDDEEYPKASEIEACRSALFALVRLQKFDALARVALDAQGQPVSTWWPVAYALQRINDPKAAPALIRLVSSPGVYAASFALRGLATLKDKSVVPLALGLAARPSADIRLRVVAVRALAQLGGAAGVDALMALVEDQTTPRNLALEAVTAIGASADPRAFELLLERMRDPWPAMRAAATLAAVKVKPDAMLLLIPSFAPDPDWSVRAALATALATLPADTARGAIQDLTVDADMRVRSAALEALAKIGAPDLATRLFEALDAPDFAVRATAARLIGEKKIEFGVERLTVAYNRGDSDATYTARAAALDALAKYGTDAAKAVIRRGLNDRDWAVRLKAADLLRGLGDAAAVAARPAPVRQPNDFFESARLLHPRYSPHAFIDTKYGTIEIELNVVEAPVTSALFIDLARAGFFNGIKVHRLVPNFVIQTGDPRGDGEGGPGYSIRDELSPLPYLRGTVGMALDGPDTGGSQFFITVSPQPHLDGKYTVFGRVVKGDEVLDLISQWDVIEAVRIWDGVSSSKLE